MKKLTVLAVGILLLVPSLAFCDWFTLRVGYFWPGAPTNVMTYPNSLWAIEFSQMSYNMSDYANWSWGASYDHFLGKYVNLSFTVDYWHNNEAGFYLDWVGTSFDEGEFAMPYQFYNGYDIVHSFNVSNTPLQVSLKFLPLGRRTRLIPYLGGGGSVNFWSVSMYGDMVNFSDPWIYTDPDLGDIDIYPIEYVNAHEHGVSFGYHAFGGFQFPIGYRTTIEAEVRYHWTKAHFNDWFVGFDDLNLNGLAVSLGVSYWF